MSIKINADYHTHTIYSDGKGTVEENVKQAIAMGLKKIAITDHGFNHTYFGGKFSKTMKKMDIILQQKQEIEELRKKYPEIEILFGIEADLISNKGDIDLTMEECKLFDIIVLGTHFSPYANTKKDTLKWKCRHWFWNTKKHSRVATQSYIMAIEKYPVNIIAHLNKVVKVNVKEIAEKAKEKGVLIELNQRGLAISESEWGDLIDSGVTMVINSDAHTPENVAKIDRIEEFLKDKEIPKGRILNLVE